MFLYSNVGVLTFIYSYVKMVDNEYHQGVLDDDNDKWMIQQCLNYIEGHCFYTIELYEVKAFVCRLL